MIWLIAESFTNVKHFVYFLFSSFIYFFFRENVMLWNKFQKLIRSYIFEIERGRRQQNATTCHIFLFLLKIEYTSDNKTSHNNIALVIIIIIIISRW